ncbi:hypothetical protein ACOSQ3_021789 [Xanthoceras sorbifolium]
MDSSELTNFVRVAVDVTQALKRCLKVDVEGSSSVTIMPLHYERLPNYWSSGKDRGRGPVLVVKDTVGKGKEVANNHNEGQVGVASENVDHHGGYTVVQSKGGSGMSAIPLSGTLQSELKLQKLEQRKMGADKGACVLIANDNAIPTMESIKKTKEKEGDSLMSGIRPMQTQDGQPRSTMVVGKAIFLSGDLRGSEVIPIHDVINHPSQLPKPSLDLDVETDTG